MTANVIAAAISETDDRLRHLEQLTELIARTVRSQLVAMLGNVGIAIPLAGLISGYFDNHAAYHRIPERLQRSSWARRLFGETRLRRIATYLGDNLGALAGNLLFGSLLGGTTFFGRMVRLPIDIRHVAFASVRHLSGWRSSISSSIHPCCSGQYSANWRSA